MAGKMKTMFDQLLKEVPWYLKLLWVLLILIVASALPVMAFLVWLAFHAK